MKVNVASHVVVICYANTRVPHTPQTFYKKVWKGLGNLSSKGFPRKNSPEKREFGTILTINKTKEKIEDEQLWK